MLDRRADRVTSDCAKRSDDLPILKAVRLYEVRFHSSCRYYGSLRLDHSSALLFGKDLQEKVRAEAPKPLHNPELPGAAYTLCAPGRFASGNSPAVPGTGPPIALVCRASEDASSEHGLGHVARLTANLLRPMPIGGLAVKVKLDYVGRNAGHFSAHLLAGGKEVFRFTALAQRESPVELPVSLAGHPLPMASDSCS